jgi:predicted XRE-type DNA-binding protein
MASGARRKSKTTINKASVDVRRSTGNVFADLGVPHPEEMLARAELARKISEIIAHQNLTQVQAAAMLGVDQPKISALLRGKLEGFSSDRLFRFLNALGNDVEIVIRPIKRGRRPAHTRVRRAS